MLIAIEGLDGSGKATQAKLLTEYLKARKISFPDYGSDSSALVKMYLSGQFGADPSDVNAYAASSFYAVDRYASFKSDWKKDYEAGTIVADRYTTSNAIHQCCKLPEEQWDSYLAWLFDFEYCKLGIPKPDVVIYLRVDPTVSQELMSERYSNDESQKDIHERNLEYLEKARYTADYCSRHLGWNVIECIRNEKMRTIDDIFAEICSIIDHFAD